MKKLLLLPVLTVLAFLNSGAQSSFQRTYGTFSEENGSVVKQTKDKGYILAGQPLIYPGPAYLVKTDSTGNKMWSEYFNISDLSDVIETSDGGYLISGNSSLAYPDKGCLVKLNSSGAIAWQKQYGNYINNFGAVHEDLDSTGFIVTGASYDSLLLMKVNATGSILWARTMKTVQPSYASDFVQLKTNSSFYVLSHYSTGGGGQQILVSKFSKNGSGVWSKKIATTGLFTFISNSSLIKETHDGKLMVSFISGNNIDFVQMDTSGNIVSPGARFSYSYDVKWSWTFANPSVDNSLMLACTDPSTYYQVSDILLSKTDTAGNISWTKRIGGNNEDGVNAIITSKDNSVVLVGYTKSFSVGKDDVYLLKSGSTGSFGCNEGVFTSPDAQLVTTTSANEYCAFNTVAVSEYLSPFVVSNVNDTSYNACGCVPPKADFSTNYPYGTNAIYDNSTWGTTWFWDYGNGDTSSSVVPYLPYGTTNGIYTICLTVTNACGTDSVCHPVDYEFTPVSVTEINKNSSVTIYPNPFNSEAMIVFDEEQKNATLKIIDVLGKEIKIISFTGKQFALEREDIKAGIYFIQITAENHATINRKIVIQ